MPLPVYRGARYQRGHGLGGTLRGLIRAAAPLVKEATKRLATKTLKKSLATANDMMRGKSFSDAFRDNILHDSKRKASGDVSTRGGNSRKRRRVKKAKAKVNRSVKQTTKSRDLLG